MDQIFNIIHQRRQWQRILRFPGVALLVFVMNGQILAQVFDVDTIQYNGSPGKFINLVFVGDGYQESELGNYPLDVQNVSDFLFTLSPWKEYKNYFNVFAISVPSAESGTDHPGTATDVNEPVFPVQSVNTYFNSTFDYAAIHRLLVPVNGSGVNAVVLTNFPLYDQKVVLVNSQYYGGSGGDNATSSLHSSAPEIVAHEIGHSFAGLADEYWAGDQYAHEAPNMTQETNPNLVRWKNWIGEDGIGIYQYCCGGSSAEWYRPHESCKMRFLGPDHPFCAVCRETITERIHDLFGSPVISRYPAQNEVSACTDPLGFTLSLAMPDPNTLRVRWKLNGLPLALNQDSITVSETELLNGSNDLTAEILDTTSLTRADAHPVDHTYTVHWTINYEPATEPEITTSGPVALCAGDSVTLTSSPAVGYLWNTGATTQSITVSTEGEYIVTITNAYGCTAVSIPVTVTTLENPEAVIIPDGTTEFCPGDSVILISSDADTYAWSNGAISQSVSVYASGTYIVTVTDENGCTAASLPTVVTVYPPPVVQIIPEDTTMICEGDSVWLSASEGTDYFWNTGDTTQQILAVSMGEYAVTVTDVNGCSGVAVPSTVIVHPLPPADISTSDSTAFCQGDSAILSASQGVSWLWNTGNTDRTLAAVNSGTYEVMVTDSNGCTSTSLPLTIDVFPLPDTPVITAVDALLSSSAVSDNQWFLNGMEIPGATDSIFEASESGSYTVMVTDSNGCVAISEPYLLTLTGTGSVFQNNTVVLIPNPGNGKFRLQLPQEDIMLIQVFDVSGRLQYSADRVKPEIDLSSKLPGIYFVLISTARTSYSGKLIIE